MSFAISISDDPDDVWMIKNSISWWFLDLVAEEIPQDYFAKEQLDISSSIGGISLDSLQKENPGLTNTVANAMIVVAQKISDGQIPCSDLHATTIQEDVIRSKFDELIRLLDRFEHQ